VYGHGPASIDCAIGDSTLNAAFVKQQKPVIDGQLIAHDAAKSTRLACNASPILRQGGRADQDELRSCHSEVL
jgi:hypothetical protein